MIKVFVSDTIRTFTGKIDARDPRPFVNRPGSTAFALQRSTRAGWVGNALGLLLERA
jgi:hypothetical protein